MLLLDEIDYKMSLIILNSSLTVTITLQNWTPDNIGSLYDTLVKKGFTISQLTATQQLQGMAVPIARKGTTTAFTIDNNTRRLIFQITNEINSPNTNIKEVLDVLTEIGFPSQESIERIDIQGKITIKMQEGKASTLIPHIIKDEFSAKADKIMGRETDVIGIRLSSKEMYKGGISKSPFLILIEPLLTDDSDTKFLVQATFSTNSHDTALDFSKNLYKRLKELIEGINV